MTVVRYAIYSVLALLIPLFHVNANDLKPNICEWVAPRQLAAIYPATLFSSQQENGCRWSRTPDGKAYFQIGVIESQKNLRQFFDKKIPPDYRLKKITDLGDRGLMTETGGCLSVIAVREGNWVLISTVDLLYIKQGDGRQRQLWDIYRRVLRNLE